MKQAQLSNADSAYLNRLARAGEFPNPNAALRQAIEYLRENHSLLPVNIDLASADGRASKTQDQWIPYFNAKQEKMISSPDLYQAGKSGSRKLLQSFQPDFDASWIVTSDRFDFTDGLSAKLTHNFGSTVVTPKETRLVVPVYQRTQLYEILRTDDGLYLVRTLFDTKDYPKRITKTLENLADKDAADIVAWTPTEQGRKDYPIRAVRFSCLDGRFHIDGVRLYDGGRSRRVSVSPRSGQQKK